MNRSICVCLVLLLFVGSGIAQQPKRWTEWSKKEVEKTLNDSAWGQTQSEGGSGGQSGSTSAITSTMAARNEDRNINAAAKAESGEAKPSTVVKYHVRFLSAKPVREAFARQVLLAQEQPNEELKGQLQSFVDRSFADYIVLAVGLEVGDQKMAAPLTRAFTMATTETLQKNVYLERKDGKKLFLMEYRAPTQDGMGAKFVFQRVLDGEPFLTEKDSVRFVAQLNEKMKLNTRYKLADMLYDGKLEY
jgi:hypothetical protein